jgi:hypothetical protein
MIRYSSRFSYGRTGYAHEWDVCLTEYLFYLLDQAIEFDGAISRLVFKSLGDAYTQFLRSGSEEDRFSAWRSVHLCCGWFCQLGGDRYGSN